MGASREDPHRIARETLSSGLELVRQPAPPGAASFSASYVGPGGWSFDPDGLTGAAVMTTQLLASGAGRWSRVEFDRYLDRLGATASQHCHPESSEVSVWGPGTEWERLVELLAAMVLEPRLESVDLERVRRQLAERQLREQSQPDSRADAELALAVFPPGHPYRLTGLGTRSSVRKIRRADVTRFHRSHFTPEGGLLVVTGRPRASSVRRVIERRFRGWGVTRAPDRPAARLPRKLDPKPRRIRLPGRSQVEIRMGGPSVARDSPMFPALFLANEVLGGRPLLNRLFQTAREKQGLVYHASSDVEAMRWGGYWVVGAGTGPERVPETLRILRRETARISEVATRSSELDRIRESAIGELPLALETTSGAHQLALDIGYHRLPDDFLDTWPTTLRSVTPSEVRRAAAEGLDARRSAAVVAGP